MANIVVAYVCWFFGGLGGLHHFYLGRDFHSFVWWSSLGGLGLGWFRDLWRLPEYVFEANQDQRYINEFAHRRTKHPKPPFSSARFAGQLLIGWVFSSLLRLCIPEEYLQSLRYGYFLSIALPIFGAALGVYLVTNIGNQQVSFKWPLIGSAIATPWLYQNGSESMFLCALFAAVVAQKKLEWRLEPYKFRGRCKLFKRILVLYFCGLLYLSLWSAVLLLNVKVTSNDGTQVPLREAVENFFHSPAWKEMKQSLHDLYQFCQYNGWGTCWSHLISLIDPTGESHAYRVLEFEDESPSPEEIQSRCRKLSRKWHPDKYKDEEKKIEAQEKFIEVQKACDILNTIRQRRQEKSMKPERAEGDKSRRSENHQHTDL